MASSASASPLFRFGMIADVQYVDRDDCYNFSGTRLRRYRHSRRVWEDALAWWRQEGVAFVAQLGDFIDGSNRSKDGEGVRALAHLLQADHATDWPVLNLVGNHELYNFTRRDLQDGIQVPSIPRPFSVAAPAGLEDVHPQSSSAYYSFRPQRGWRILVLDPYEVSLLSQGGGRPGIEFGPSDLDPRAVALCQRHNPNDVTKEDFARGIPEGPSLRWVPLNGSVGPAQLAWLRQTLQRAHEDGERTMILSHVILLPEATPRGSCLTLLWNYEEVLRELREAETAPVAVFCGHAHLPVHAIDEATGTHHVTLPSPLEAPIGTDSSATVEVFEDGTLLVRGPSGVMAEIGRGKSARARL